MQLEKNRENKNELLTKNLEELPTFSLTTWIENSRLRVRKALVSNPMNVPTILGFLPFGVAFFHFVSTTKKSDSKTESFFSKNLPIFVNFKPQLNYETFQYISASTLKNRGTLSHSTFFFGQPKFVAKCKNRNSNEKPASFLNFEKKVSGLHLSFYTVPSGSFFNQIDKSTRNLDELPSYVQGLRKMRQVDDDKSLTFYSESVSFHTKKEEQVIEEIGFNPKFISPLILENSFAEKLETNQNKFFNFWKLKQPLHFVTNKNLTDESFKTPSNLLPKISLVKSTSLDTAGLSPGVSVKNTFFKNKIEYFKSVEQLDAVNENLFLRRNFPFLFEIDEDNEDFLSESDSDSPESLQTEKDLVLPHFSEQKSEIENNSVLETILRTLEQETISDDISSCRLMSGYNYPDTASDNLAWYYKQNSFFRNFFSQDLQPDHLPTLFSTTKYKVKIQNIPSFSIETKNITVTSKTDNKVFYTGPGLLLDSKKALDWKLSKADGFSLRTWFHNYMSPLNPLSPTPKNFIGRSAKSLNFSEFENFSLFQDVLPEGQEERESPFPFSDIFISPSQSSWYPPASPSNFLEKTGFTRGYDILLSKEDDPIEKTEFLPIIETRDPVFKTASKKPFKGYSSLFDLGITAKPDYKFSLEFSQDPTTRYDLNSGRYLPPISIFSTQSRSLRVDNWEPLTTQSWLVISQWSFFLFSFQVYKSFVASYGKEIVAYLLNLIAALGILDDALKQELEYWMGERDKGFRVLLDSKKTFRDIVGVEKFLPELSEVIWFLRNAGREFQLSRTLPRGILLTGPPGTGKTLLVQALAGEAKIPVVVLSGSSLIEPGESGGTKLEMAFQEAKQVAPCIVFIDEIDTLAQKRLGIVQRNPMAQDGIVELLIENEHPLLDPTEKEFNEARVVEDPHALEPDEPTREQITLLTQLLIEVDGIKGRDGLLVIGATNRPEVLDPALLRPGRFEKRIHVGLPTPEKRVEILQFYGNQLGYQSGIPWDYLGERTVGFSAADLAALMNESAIKAILNQSYHNVKTIEHGIDRLTTSESEKHIVVKTKSRDSALFSIPSKLSIVRLAYYQAGKVLVSYFLENHPKSVFASLWPRRPTIRSLQIAKNLQNSVFEFAQLPELQDRVVGVYGGKAAETLFLEKFSVRRHVHRSTLGVEDLVFAQNLISFILEKSLYSKKSKIQKLLAVIPNKNPREFQLVPEQMDVYNELLEEIEMPPMKKTLELNTSSLKSTDEDEYEALNAQVYYPVPWWQQETSNEFLLHPKNPGRWTRFFLYNPEMNERNVEWIPPDVFYHRLSSLKNVKTAFTALQKLKKEQKKLTSVETEKSSEPNQESKKTQYPRQNVHFSWNEIPKITREYPAQSLALQSFNKALVLLNQNRELLDQLVVELLYQEILRKPDIERLVKDFTKIQPTKVEIDVFESSKDIKPLKLIESAWGPKSRKPMPRWIDFTIL
jgi:ATP-dependent Zn protease